MKYLLFFVFYALLSCSSLIQGKKEMKAMTVISVNSHSFGYIITCAYAQDTILILSKSSGDWLNCEKTVRPGISMSIEIVRQYKIEIDGATEKIGFHDLYFDNVLVFPRAYLVFISPSLDGLCITSE